MARSARAQICKDRSSQGKWRVRALFYKFIGACDQATAPSAKSRAKKHSVSLPRCLAAIPLQGIVL
jgi:hypothetical protein